MTSKIHTILIVGATSGIGEAYARRFHSLGKNVIITGRRVERLAVLEEELPGLKTLQWDVTDFSTLPDRVSAILNTHPSLDTVFINAGIQKSFSILDPSSSTPSSIASEIDSNLTAPILLTRLFLPHLVSRAQAGHTVNLLLTSSSLAYVPLGFYPVYCPTKAAIHAFLVSVRAQLSFAPEEVRRNLSLVEIVPPYVDTGLDAAHRAATIAMQGGEDKAFPAMPLEEYIEKAFASLEEVDAEGKLKKEVGVGFGQVGIDTWRGSFGKILEGMGINS